MTNGGGARYGVEGFKVLRVAMVLSSLSPLFVLWGIRGSSIIPDRWLGILCTALVLFPNVLLQWRISSARANCELRRITVGSYDDNRRDVLVYLFGNMLPFYRTAVETFREFLAMCVALGFIVFLFWHLRLHYINILYTLQGYRAFAVYSPRDGNPFTGRETTMLLTNRRYLIEGEEIVAHQITDSVYLEPKNAA